MKKYTKIYLDFFDYGEHEDIFVPCEICGQRCVDVHHIDPKGIGGSKSKDVIENLIGLCRQHHIKAEREPQFNELCRKKHIDFMDTMIIQGEL